MTFGKRLAEARNRKKLTQTELGRGLGTDGADAGKSVVYGWEKDDHYPRVDQLVPICLKLDCSADWLLFGTDEQWPFTRELQQAVLAADAPERRKLENLMRVHLSLPALPPMDDAEHQARESEKNAAALREAMYTDTKPATKRKRA